MSWTGNKVNSPPNKIQRGPDVSNIRVGESRSSNIRRDKDKVKNPAITLIDIDTTIINHLDKEINPDIVVEGNTRLKVPITYASPEVWAATRKAGVFRDYNGKIQCPVIMINRTSFGKNESLMTLNRNLSYPVLTTYDEKNAYDQFSLLSDPMVKPVRSIYSVSLGDNIKVTYSIKVWTTLVEQMNMVIEKINFAMEDYWGDKHRYRFRVYAGDYSSNVEVSSGEDRMVSTEFDITVMAYLMPDSFEDKESTIRKLLTARKVVMSESAVSDINTIDTQNVSENSIKAKLVDNYIVLEEDMKTTKIKQAFNNLVQAPTIVPNTNNVIWHFPPPASSTAYGEEGWQSYDNAFHYIYVGGSWKRQPITNFNEF